MADKLNENKSNSQDKTKQTIDAIFKNTYDYLSKLEKSMGELLKKFNLNNETFDGDLNGKGTTKNKIEELYNDKILNLKRDLDSNKDKLNKSLLIGQLIGFSLSARGIELNNITKLAKDNLNQNKFNEFEEEKNKLFNSKEVDELKSELKGAEVSIDDNYFKSEETINKEKTEKEKKDLKKEAVSLLEKTIKKEIEPNIFEEKFKQTLEYAEKLNIKDDVIEAFSNKVKEIDLSQTKQIGERSMVSGVLPLTLIMTPGLKRIVPTLPAVIGVGIWARLMQGSATDRAMAVIETIGYIAPISGTFLSGKDTIDSLKKYYNGTGDGGDVIANAIGTLVSAGFDVATILLALSGVGAPAAVGTAALKVSAVNSIKFGVKKLSSVITKEVVEKGEQKLFKETFDSFVKGKKDYVSSAWTELGATRFIGQVGKHSLKETYNGIKTVASLNIKGIKEMFSKEKDIATTLKDINNATKGEQEASTLKDEENKTNYSENLSSKNIDGIVNEVKETINKNENSEDLKDIMNIVKTQDEHMGNSLNIMIQLFDSVKKYNKIRNSSEKTGDINALSNIINEIESTIKSQEGKISKGLYEYLERVISKMKKGEDFSETSGNYKLIQNKIYGSQINTTFVNDNQLKEYNKLIEDGETQSMNGYMGNYMKTLNELNNIDFKKLKGEKADVFIENYLDLLKNAEHNGNGLIRAEGLKAAEKGENHITLGKETGYENIIETLLKNPKTSHIRDIIIKHTDLSLITRVDLKEKIVKEGFENISKMDTKDAINQLKHLSFYADYKKILKGFIEGNNKNKKIIENFIKETNSNKDLLTLIDFAEGKNYNNIEERIIKNISNNTQINSEIGVSDEAITKNELNNLLLDTSKLGDEKFKEIIKIIEEKTGKNIINLVESHEIIAKLFKFNPKKFEDLVIKEISGNNTSIEYKIKLIEELEKNGISMKESYESLNNYIKDADEVNFSNKLDYFENFYKNSEYYKQNPVKDLEMKIEGFKNYKHYKDLSKIYNEKLGLLLDTDRAFSDRFIKDLKNSGEISHYTLNKIDEVISNGVIKTSDGKIIKNLNENDIAKLEKVREQVKTALGTYEFNLFDNNQFKEASDQGEYLFKVIDQMSGWKLTKGVDNSKEVNRTIVKQLNVLKNNFNISPEVIDKFIYKVLGNKEKGCLNVEEKINLLKVLEKTGVIKPSVEHKLEYIIALDAKASDLRADVSHIKAYAKNFEQGLQETNLEIKEMKEKGNKDGIKKLVENTIKERVPVEESYLDGKDLKEGIDYVKIDDKIYITEIFPSRYFLTKMLETTDLRQKESYMELIHNKKEFGDQSIKDYFKNTNDIQSKILLSYHDELKYDPEVIKFLQEAVKTNPKEVAYAMSKRRDFDIISGEKGKINEALLDKMLTHEYIEEKLGRKIDNVTYEKYKDGIKKMILFTENKEFRNLVIGIRTSDDLDEKRINEIVSNVKNAGIAIDESLLASKEFLMIIFTVRSSDRDKKNNNFDNILNDFIKGEEGIKSILNDKLLKNIIISIRAEREQEYKDYDINKDLDKKLGAGINIKAEYYNNHLNLNILAALGIISILAATEAQARNVGNLTKAEYKKLFEDNLKSNPQLEAELKKNPAEYDKYIDEQFKIYQNKMINNVKNILNNKSLEEIIKSVSDEDLKLAKEEGLKIKDSGTGILRTKYDILGKELELKDILGLLVTYKIMTATEAQAAEQEIGDKWQSSPEFKEYQRLGGEKSEAAKKLKEDTIRAITTEVLKPYIASFDVKYQAMMEKKIQEMPLGLQTLLANIDTKIMEKINKNHSPTEINMLNTFIYQYVKSIKDDGGACVSNLDKITSKFPELAGTDVDKLLREIGTNYDEAAKNRDEAAKWKEINDKLKNI